MPKNGGTSYWGTAGIFVSNNEQESPESRDLYAEVCRNWADQKSLTGLDFIMRKKIESMPQVLATSGPVDLNVAMQSLQKNTLAALGQTIMDQLRVLQAAEMPVTTLTSANGKQMVFTAGKDLTSSKSADPLTDVENFLKALQDFNNQFDALAKKGTEIDVGDWERVKRRFFLKTKGKGGYGPNQVFYACAHRILNGQGTEDDYGRIYGLIRGQFGNDIGNMMEGVLADILNLPQIQQQILDVIDTDMGDMASAVVRNTGKGAAQQGTIRFTPEISFTQTKMKAPPAAKLQGNRLSDNRITLTSSGMGAKVTIGLSAKNLNFHSSYYKAGQVDIASLSIGKFAPVFSNISVSRLTQRVTNKGQYALYGYRALNENHEPNSPLLSYLLAHRIGEIAFGTRLDGSMGDDFAPLMSINGKLWNTRDYLLNYGGKLRISTEQFPDVIPKTWWQPQNALNYVSDIHKANIRVQLRFGRQAAISKFSS